MGAPTWLVSQLIPPALLTYFGSVSPLFMVWRPEPEGMLLKKSVRHTGGVQLK